MTIETPLSTCRKLKSLIKESLNLEDLALEDFQEDALLFGPEGIGLDSLDAVELVVLIQKHFGVQIRDMEESRLIFRSVKTLADHIDAARNHAPDAR